MLELLRRKLISRPPNLHPGDDPSGGRLFGNVGGKRFNVRVAPQPLARHPLYSAEAGESLPQVAAGFSALPLFPGRYVDDLH